METINVKIEKIVIDKDQPRKLFDAEKIARLKDSILKYGIMNPLKVEKMASGDYMLVDGERRYRAAKEANLKEVPVIVSKAINANDRLIRQFHIQQQTEDWTPVEKAMAVIKLAEETKMSIEELGIALAVPRRNIQRYVEFGQLVDKEAFLRTEMGIEWAGYINGAATTARLTSQRELHKPFTHTDEKNIEKAIISRVLNGEFQRPSDVSKLKDAFRTDPKTIQTFIDSPRTTAMDLFEKSGARGNYHLRSIMNSVRGVNTHGKHLMEAKSGKLDKVNTKEIKRAIDFLKQLVDLAE